MSRFSLIGLSLLEGGDPLGIWEMDAPEGSSAAAEAFGTGGAAMVPGDVTAGLVWRVELPASRSQASGELGERFAKATARQAGLETAAKRLDNLSAGLAYSVQSTPAEYALLAEAMALRGSAMAYGTGDAGLFSPAKLYEQCQELLGRFQRLVQYYARVETSVGGRLVALTVVDWSGDYDVTWQDGVSEPDTALHLDAVRLALATRQAWLRLVSVVASGALSLSLKASVPGGQFLLIPAVYKFVRDVLAELEQVQIGAVSPG